LASPCPRAQAELGTGACSLHADLGLLCEFRVVGPSSSCYSFLCTSARSALRFGNALIAMSLLAPVAGVQVATPQVASGAYFLPTGLAILTGLGLAGLWSRTVLRLHVCALPVMMAAIFLDGRLNRVKNPAGASRARFWELLQVPWGRSPRAWQFRWRGAPMELCILASSTCYPAAGSTASSMRF